MSVLNRFSEIVKSNFSSALDRAEDPEKMVRFITREMEEALVQLRENVRQCQKDSKRIVQHIPHLQEQSAHWQQRAELAIDKNRDDLAKAALHHKHLQEEAIISAEAELVTLESAVNKLEQDQHELMNKLKFAKSRQASVVQRGDTVRSRLTVKRLIHNNNCEQALDRFEAYERKLEAMESEVESYELGGGSLTLENEIARLEDNEHLNLEIEALKERMTKTS